LNLDNSRIAQPVTGFNRVSIMEFLEAVILALISGVVAPLAVYYIKAAFPPKAAKGDSTKPD